MKLSVTSGERQVHISVRGASAKRMRRVEKTARRLLATGPEPMPPKSFGFSAAADTQLSYQDD